jgi:DNA-binding CsgD family transcriptional regulator
MTRSVAFGLAGNRPHVCAKHDRRTAGADLCGSTAQRAGAVCARVAPVLGLSPRETQVLTCVLAGLTEAGIAQALGISTHTVHTHLERLYRKLGIHSRTQLLLVVVNELADPAGCPFTSAADAHSGDG